MSEKKREENPRPSDVRRLKDTDGHLTQLDGGGGGEGEGEGVDTVDGATSAQHDRVRKHDP
jgi:hypothetical protein